MSFYFFSFCFLFFLMCIVSCPSIFSNYFSCFSVFSLEKTITKLDLLQFDTLFSFAELGHSFHIVVDSDFSTLWLTDDVFGKELAFLTDETFGKASPLDSVLKIEGIMRACRSSTEQLEWILIQMSDLCLNRQIQPAEMQPFYLFGKGQQKGTLRYTLVFQASHL